MPETATEIKLTPMMEQYRAVKKTLPADTLLFFRLGDFYEMFFEDAVRASEILDITLTGREGGEAGRVPMCGVPYHSTQGYVKTLLDHNLKVAICEQIGDPKAGRGLVERKITRIITPATYLEEESKEARAEYMAAAAADDTLAALATLDLGTGDFFVREIPLERLAGELSILNPREIILPKSLTDDAGARSPRAPAQGGGTPPLHSFIKDHLRAAVTVYEDWIFEKGEGERMLVEVFRLGSPAAISFDGRPLAVGASGAILYYLRDHLHSALGHLRLPRFLEASDHMILDRQTIASLELVECRGGVSTPSGAAYGRGDRSPTLLNCIDRTLTSMGSRTLYHWLTHPLLCIPEIVRRQEAVSEFVRRPDIAEPLASLFRGVKDMERTLSRLNCGLANARDLVNLKLFLERVPALQVLLSELKAPLHKETSVFIRPFEEIQNLIARSIVDEPPLGLRDGGLIREGYSPELDQLRQISKKGKSWILDFEKSEIERTGIKSLKVKYSQVFGYAIEVSKAHLHHVPSDYIRRQTLASAERFIVPELRAWDEKISGAEERIKIFESRLFNEIREKVLQSLDPLQAMARAVGVLDSLLSLALSAAARGWVRPEVADSDEILITGGRHPVVEASLPAGQFVENDTRLDRAENQLIVLTGPNMAGKSTYIRQAAQIVLLAQMGSFVPAASARIGLVDRIFTRIGASDDLARGESTFMVEMVETAHILQKATARSLIIFDEVGRGTSTFDGVSIAWAICEFLAGTGPRPRTLFATHYHELTKLEGHFPALKNYNIAVKETKDGIIFLRKVVRGGSDRSYGIHVARLAGIPESVTRRAEEILAILESENTQATEIIESRSGRKKKADSRQPELF